MKTIFVAGNDTDVGKTWVVATLAAELAAEGRRIQIVKPLQSGLDQQDSPDADTAMAAAQSALISAYTLHSYQAALAPHQAAALEGESITMKTLLAEISDLPSSDCRIVEGAGSFATPLDAAGNDWRDFAVALKPDYVVLVISDKLGGIGQARLTCAYAESSGLDYGVWLNETGTQPEQTRRATYMGIVESKLPLIARTSLGSMRPEWLTRDLLS